MTPRQENESVRREIVRLLHEAGERCRRRILNPPGRKDSAKSFHASRAAQMLQSLNRELTAISARVVSTTVRGLAAAYRQGLLDADMQAREAGVLRDDGLGGSFNVVDRRRAQVLIEQTVKDLHGAVVSMRETTGKIVRKCQALNLDNKDVNALLARGTIEGQPRAALRELREMVDRAAIKGQIVTVNRRTGVVCYFKPQDYADLVYQTKSAETTTAATMERLRHHSVKYVKVIGSNSRNFCSTFLEKAFYIGDGDDPTGRYFSSRLLPRGGPPFHPRCTKRFVAFVPGLKTEKQLERSKLQPHQEEFLGIDDRAAGKRFRRQERERHDNGRARAATGSAADQDADLVTVLKGTPAADRGEPIPRPDRR